MSSFILEGFLSYWTNQIHKTLHVSSLPLCLLRQSREDPWGAAIYTYTDPRAETYKLATKSVYCLST